MITPENIYWITRLDPINRALSILCVVLVISAVFSTVAWIVNVADSDKKAAKACKTVSILSIIFAIVFGLGLVFTPTTKEALFMYVPTKVIDGNKIIKDVGDVYDLTINQLKEYLGEKLPKAEVQNDQ